MSEQYSEVELQRLHLGGALSCLSGSLKDAYRHVAMGKFPADAVDDAINDHLEVLTKRDAIAENAYLIDDEDRIYKVIAGMALIRFLSPWKISEVGAINDSVKSDGLNHGLVTEYRKWLVGTVDPQKVPTAQVLMEEYWPYTHEVIPETLPNAIFVWEVSREAGWALSPLSPTNWTEDGLPLWGDDGIPD